LLRGLLERGVSIPPQCRIVGELARQLAAPDIDLRITAATLRQDPLLIDGLFRLAGNGAYAQHGELASVECLLRAIGVRRTFNLVRALALSRSISGPVRHHVDERFWLRARSIAELSMLVAHDRYPVCGVFADEAYLAGLFMDCGVPMLMGVFSDYCAGLFLDGDGRWPDLAVEDGKVNIDHALVGYFVACHWQLPDNVCQAVRFHHQIAQAADHSAAPVVAILNLARHIWHLHHGTEDAKWHAVADDTLRELRLEDEHRFEVVDAVLERFRRAA
jgi:HD-like signal output (HDOD) protein